MLEAPSSSSSESLALEPTHETSDKTGVRLPRAKRPGISRKDSPIQVPEIVERYLGSPGRPGEKLADIAKQGGMSKRALYYWMLSGLGEEKYREVVTQCLVARIADADDALEQAKDQIDVAKYREIARFARMDFERRRPMLYGPKAVVAQVSVPGMDNELAASMTLLLQAAAKRALGLPEKTVVSIGSEGDKSADAG